MYWYLFFFFFFAKLTQTSLASILIILFPASRSKNRWFIANKSRVDAKTILILLLGRCNVLSRSILSLPILLGKDELLLLRSLLSSTQWHPVARESALYRPIFPRFQLAYRTHVCAHSVYISRRHTRKRGYMPLTVSHYENPDLGANLFRPRRPGRGATIAPSVAWCSKTREKDGERGGMRVIDKKNGVYCPGRSVKRRGKEGMTSRRDAVGMFSQARGDHL